MNLLVGGGGFVGTNLAWELANRGENTLIIDDYRGLGPKRPLPTGAELVNLPAKSLDYSALPPIDRVFYLAGRVAGVTYNRSHNTAMLEANLDALRGLRSCYELRPRVIVLFSSACVYPATAPVPTPEEWGQRDLPEETNLGYGMAKRTGEVLAECLCNEYGIDTVIVRPFNLFGPWDWFDAKYGHFIGAVLKQMFDGQAAIRIFGGNQTRAFVYVEDAVRTAIELAEQANGLTTVNVGHDQRISIRSATEQMADRVRYRGNIKFIEGPVGYKERGADCSRLESLIGPVDWTDFDSGLSKTVEWFLQ